LRPVSVVWFVSDLAVPAEATHMWGSFVRAAAEPATSPVNRPAQSIGSFDCISRRKVVSWIVLECEDAVKAYQFLYPARLRDKYVTRIRIPKKNRARLLDPCCNRIKTARMFIVRTPSIQMPFC
jgi:hypothetical protein